MAIYRLLKFAALEHEMIASMTAAYQDALRVLQLADWFERTANLGQGERDAGPLLKWRGAWLAESFDEIRWAHSSSRQPALGDASRPPPRLRSSLYPSP
jgi:hypothetical protein